MTERTPTPIAWTAAEAAIVVLREAINRAASDMERIAEMPPMSRGFEVLNIANRLRSALTETAQ